MRAYAINSIESQLRGQRTPPRNPPPVNSIAAVAWAGPNRLVSGCEHQVAESGKSAKMLLVHKAMLFDLGRVLVHFDFRRGYEALEKDCGIPAADIPRRLAPTGLVERFETGLIEPRPFFDEFRRILELDLEYARFCEIWSCIFTHQILPQEMLEGLHRRYRMVLLSNTNALHFEMIRQWYAPLLSQFDELVLSYEVGAMKPRPEIFDRAIQAAQCAPVECFYTDDIAPYVEAARAKGIDAVLFESREQLESALRARSITWHV